MSLYKRQGKSLVNDNAVLLEYTQYANLFYRPNLTRLDSEKYRN